MSALEFLPGTGRWQPAWADGGVARHISNAASVERPLHHAQAGECRVGRAPSAASNCRGQFDPPLPLPVPGRN